MFAGILELLWGLEMPSVGDPPECPTASPIWWLEAADYLIYDPVGCAEFVWSLGPVWSLGWAVQQFQNEFPGLILPPAHQTLLELLPRGKILSESKDKRWKH